MAVSLTKAAGCSSKVEEQIAHLLTDVAALLDALLVVAGRLRVVNGEAELLEAHQTHTLSSDAQQIMNEYFQNLMRIPDPAHCRAVAEIGTDLYCKRRQDLLDDDAWYSSEHVRVLRQPAGLDAIMFSSIGAADGDELYGMSFHRAWGMPQFSERDRAIAALVQAGMSVFFDGTRKRRENMSVINELPLQLRRTLVRLLRGDSEKQAAQNLDLSQHTVHQYVKSLHRRLGVRSRGELMALCNHLHVTADLLDAEARAKGRPALKSKSEE